MKPDSGDRMRRIRRDRPPYRFRAETWGQNSGTRAAGRRARVYVSRQLFFFPLPGCRSALLLSAMKPPTDYIRHAARLARKLQMEGAMGSTPQPDAEFYKTLSKAFDEIAAGLELVGKPD